VLIIRLLAHLLKTNAGHKNYRGAVSFNAFDKKLRAVLWGNALAKNAADSSYPHSEHIGKK
jgi:hypothetical protein